jgi:three-Cys-motif partner protein
MELITNTLNEPSEEWGGHWTQQKLDAFTKYVSAYLTILKKHPHWKTIYFDGFAGSGNRKSDKKSNVYHQLHLTQNDDEVYKGAAERILNTPSDQSFDYYYFVDLNETSLNKLQSKLENSPITEGKILEFRAGDANKQIIKLAHALKSGKFAALIFLDPFGMQIDWSSIEQLKGTRSDLWILVPTGVIVNRLLDKAGKLTHLEKLESFFGLSEAEIRARFYKREQVTTLFGEPEEIVAKVSQPIQKIAELYIERLNTIWTEVTKTPLVLKNSMNTPIFHFVFASNNKTGLKIAKDILKPY